MKHKFSVSAEPLQHTIRKDGRGGFQPPHTAIGAEGEDDGEHIRQRVLAVKLDLKDDETTYKLIRDLSWQAARYRNLFLRARWAEAKQLCIDPTKGIPHDVTKQIRSDEKGDLSGSVYSACEREVASVWSRDCRRILAGGPLSEWSPNAALSIRGHKRKQESGIRISEPAPDHLMAQLQIRAHKCEGGSWVEVPLAMGTAKDWQIDLLRQMISWEVPIAKASLVIKPFRHQIILRLCYAVRIPLPKFGNRCATLGPIGKGGQLFLRTECDSIDYSGRLHVIRERKDSWDLIRRRAMTQIGRRKGAARTKRKVLAHLTWTEWLATYLHQWSRELVNWLDSQGIGKLTVIGLGNEDWAAFKFTAMLKYKCESAGITLTDEADLAEAGTERAVKMEIQRARRKTTKTAAAIRTLSAEL